MSSDPNLGWWLSSAPPSARQVTDFDTALNEAMLLSAEVATAQRGVSLTFAVLSLSGGWWPGA